jgi:hypothetical protein
MTKDWIKCSNQLPQTEGYYRVRYDDGTEDQKPFRIRPSKGINGFMTEKNVVAWKENN